MPQAYNFIKNGSGTSFPGRLLNVLCTFNLHPVYTGSILKMSLGILIKKVIKQAWDFSYNNHYRCGLSVSGNVHPLFSALLCRDNDPVSFFEIGWLWYDFITFLSQFCTCLYFFFWHILQFCIYDLELLNTFVKTKFSNYILLRTGFPLDEVLCTCVFHSSDDKFQEAIKMIISQEIISYLSFMKFLPNK